jgi:putative Mg2+ transporter-C (MgtC) family protein
VRRRYAAAGKEAYVSELELVAKVLGAGLLGFAIGIERELMGSPAGDRTFSLVAMGAALFTALSIEAFGGGSPDRVAANIVTGVGFLGGGMILKDGGNVRGLTTAAGIWATAALGMAVATDRYVVAVATAVAIMLVFAAERVYSFKRRGQAPSE